MNQSLNIESIADGVIISVKVVPGGSRDAVARLLGDALKVKVSAPPEGGKANKAVCKLLAELLGIAPRDVQVVSGHSQPNKRIAIRGVDVRTVRARLL